jgi:hypothetical protein
MRRRGRRHIRHLTDVLRGAAWHDPDVVITIQLDAFDPPVGRVSLIDGRALDFSGWLGLLQVLAHLVHSAPQ